MASQVFQPPDADTIISNLAPESNYGDSSTARVGYESGKFGNVIWRALLKFDISSLVGATVDAGSKLEVNVQEAGGGHAFTCHRITQAGWTEGGVTWKKYDGVNNWAVPGGDFATPTVPFTSPTATGWQTILTGAALATYLQDALDSRSGIAHMLLKADNESVDNDWLFKTKEAFGGFGARLTVVYSAPPPPKGHPWAL